MGMFQNKLEKGPPPRIVSKLDLVALLLLIDPFFGSSWRLLHQPELCQLRFLWVEYNPIIM